MILRPVLNACGSAGVKKLHQHSSQSYKAPVAHAGQQQMLYTPCGRHTTKTCEQTMRMSHSHFNIMSLMPCLHAPAAPAGMQHIHKTAIIIMSSHIYWLYSRCSPALRGYLQSIQRNLAIAGFAQFGNGQIVGACVRYTYYA